MTHSFVNRKLKKIRKIIHTLYERVRKELVLLCIKEKDFTVISNNCWAGKVYKYFDLPYLSPTVGLYFFAEDYLKFIKNLRYYLSIEPVFISAQSSRYYAVLQERNQLHIPIAKLDDVEIMFLHYKSAEEAAEKWKRRSERVNFDHIIIKFSKMNLCTDEMLKEFDDIPFSNKFVFVPDKHSNLKSAVYLKSDCKDEILNDSTDFPGNIRIIPILTKKKVTYK